MNILKGLPYAALALGVFTVVLFFGLGAAAAIIIGFFGMIVSMACLFLELKNNLGGKSFSLGLIALVLNSAPIFYLVVVRLVH
jgi:hypothetical protein